ncbi:MAG: polysaccharide biosynthesis protein [Flavobacteriaceae bacterium]|nr:polysaccharide biosynthesis protein [Flavobacteriaceae bacterium]
MIQNYLYNKLHQHASKWVVLFIDLGIVGFSFIISYIVRFNLSLNFDRQALLFQLPLVVGIHLFSFLIIGSYKGVVRHTGIRDVYNIFNAICLSSIVTITLVMVNREYQLVDNFTIPISIIVINSMVTFMFMTASRYFFKYFYHAIVNDDTRHKNILIYGAGKSGIITYNAIMSSTNKIAVVGYIDRDLRKVGKRINGVPVFSPKVLNHEFVDKYMVEDVIFSIQDIERKRLRELVQELVILPLKVKIVPPVDDWINGELQLSQIKNVQIEDLLDRTPISLKTDNIANEVRNQVIFVTGGAGSIGSEIVRQIAQYDYKSLVVIDQAESALYDLQQELKQNNFYNFIPIVSDVRDKNRMNYLFNEYKPNLVFHAAAYKHVPLMEYNSYEAIKINIGGTKNMADLAVEHHVKKFVLISTDKAVNPTNVMGASKRIAEIYVSCLQQKNKTKFITTRFGNVLGSNGSVIPLFKKQIENGGPLTVTDKEVTRYFMTIPEASQLVLEAGAMGQGGEIFIFDMGESVKIFDLAKNMIRLSGLQYPTDIDIKITGLRPGEKLYEELLANGENTLPTHHKKIMISKTREMDFATIKSQIEELTVNNMFFSNDMVKLMKVIVPEFVSKNSIFEKYDQAKDEEISVDTENISQN